MKLQITSDPRRTLANAVPLAVRGLLPIDVTKHLEKRIDAFANWGTTCSLPDSGEPATEFDQAEVGGKTYRSYSYGEKGARFVQGGSLHGIAIGDSLAILNSPLRALEYGEKPKGAVVDFSKAFKNKSAGTSRYYQIGGSRYGKATSDAQADWASSALKAKENNYENLAESISSGDEWIPNPEPQALGDSGAPGSSGMGIRPPASHTNGTKTVLILRAQSPAWPLHPTLLVDGNITSGAADINARFAYISNNRMSINFAITPVYTLPASFDTFDTNAWMNEALSRAQSDGYNVANYQVHSLIHGATSVGYAGLMGGNRMWLKNTFHPFAFVHEFGHYLSLPHAGFFAVSDGNPMSPNWVNVSYGDSACYMGNSFNLYNQGIYNPAYQNKLRWMNDGDVQTITRSGTYTIYQYDGPTENRVRALKLPRDDNFTFWLSIRGNVASNYPAHGNGVTVRLQQAWYEDNSWVIDMHPNDGGSENASLLLNEEWYDSAADLRIKTIAVGGTSPNRYATVQVTLGPTHNAGYRPLVNGGIYRFSSRANAGLSLSGAATSTDGQSIVMATSSDTDVKQQWVANRNSDGTYSFNLLGTSLNMDVNGNAYANGTDILQYTALNTDAQKFYVTQTSEGYINFGHRGPEGHSNFVIDVNSNNWNVQQLISNGAVNQQWKPELIGLTTNRKYRLIPNNAQGQALDVDGSTGGGNGSYLQIWNWNGGLQQQWNFESITGGFRFRSEYVPTRNVDINQVSGKAQIWDINNASSQRFTFARSGGHWVRIIPGYNSGLSLEATGGTANGTRVNAKPENAGTNQRWRFADVDG